MKQGYDASKDPMIKFINRLVFVFMLVLIATYGCVDTSKIEHKDIPVTQSSTWYFHNELMESKYFFDERTSLCFLVGSSGPATWYAHVPCSETVLSLIVNKEPPSKDPVEINGKKYIEIQ